MTDDPQTVDNTKPSREDEMQRLEREESMDSYYLLPLSSVVRVPKTLRKILQRNKSLKSMALNKQHEDRKDTADKLSTDKIEVLKSSCSYSSFTK